MKFHRAIIATAALLFAVSATAQERQQDPEQDQAEQQESQNETVEQKQILVVADRPNKITDKKHPDYVRCKSEPVIGSLAKRKRTCLTNRQWELNARDGNDTSREFIQQQQAGFGQASN